MLFRHWEGDGTGDCAHRDAAEGGLHCVRRNKDQSTPRRTLSLWSKFEEQRTRDGRVSPPRTCFFGTGRGTELETAHTEMQLREGCTASDETKTSQLRVAR